MLHKTKQLQGYKLQARDGEIGKVTDFYFDDETWTVRYLVADAGHWYNNRKVLISPYALSAVDPTQEVIRVDLNQEQIKNSPSWNSAQPVSRQFEQDYYAHYGWPIYWGGAYAWGMSRSPALGPYGLGMNRSPALRGHTQGTLEDARRAEEESNDPHLRSTRDVTKHHIQAADGEIGHVEDFLLDAESWTIRYLVTDTRNWWPGKKVLVSPEWIDRISWDDSRVFVNLSREKIKQAPEYSELTLFTRDNEIQLHRHYDKEGYWTTERAKQVSS